MNFTAPWGNAVKWTTSLVTAVFVVMMLLELITGGRHGLMGILAMIVLPLAIMLAAIIFSVRGYSVSDREITVRRFLWSTHFSTNTIKYVSMDNLAMTNALRVGGNGGLFAFTGNFTSARLGKFRALVTDPRHTLVMELKDGRKIVMSPSPAEDFVQAVNHIIQKSGL